MNPLSKTIIRYNGQQIKVFVSPMSEEDAARVISYSRFASLTFPFVALGLGLFAFMNLTQTKVECPPVEVAAPIAQAMPPIVETPHDTKAAFEKIYGGAVWGTNAGGVGNSGTGSTLQSTYIYRRYLAQFFQDHDVKSVVDAGCGDWEFSQKIDWTGIDYKGFDIVAKVIEADKAQFTKPNISFAVGNIVEDDLPAADVLISKHVLQHLPNSDIKKFLDKQLKKYKHVILTNGVHPMFLTGQNEDIKPGEYRTIDLTREPFNIRGLKELTYWANGHMHQVLHIDNTLNLPTTLPVPQPVRPPGPQK